MRLLIGEENSVIKEKMTKAELGEKEERKEGGRDKPPSQVWISLHIGSCLPPKNRGVLFHLPVHPKPQPSLAVPDLQWWEELTSLLTIMNSDCF